MYVSIRPSFTEIPYAVFCRSILQYLCIDRKEGLQLRAHDQRLRVVVSQRIDWVESRCESRDSLDQRMVEWLSQVGVLAFPVPNSLHSNGRLDHWLEKLVPQAVVLSGGNDIGNCLSRDATERALLRYASERTLPVLGICRGMQMMGCYAGGKLQPVKGHVASRHSLQPKFSSDEYAPEVNSYHEFCLSGCPDGYEVTAVATDGTIEAIRRLGKPWEAWMWHPEREKTFVASDIERARKILFGDTSK